MITAALGGLIVGTTDDKESPSSLAMADIAAIRESINMLMIGKVKRSVAKAAIEAFALEGVANEILAVASNKGRYQRAFYLNIDTRIRWLQELLDLKYLMYYYNQIYITRLISSNEIDLDDEDDDEN